LQQPLHPLPEALMLNLRGLDAHHKKREAAHETARCPRCRTWSPRNEIRSRFFWEPSLLQPTVVELRVGCYLCPECPQGKRWFATLPPEFQTNQQYSLRAQEMVVELVRAHKLSLEAAAEVGRSMLHLDKLHPSTVLCWLRDAGDAVDTEGRRRALVETFSGQMAVDEVYDGGWYQLKATDPLNDVELLWKLGEGSPSKEDIRRFFLELKAIGFMPKLVVTDGSNLYPEVIIEVWPDAKHQRCVFHFIKQINADLLKAFRAAYDTMPKPPKRKRGRPKKRGRPRKDKAKRMNRRKVRAARYLFLKRESRPGERARFTDKERAALGEAMQLCPPLRVLRRFVVQVHELFSPTTDSHKLAAERRSAILTDPEFAATKGLSSALDRLRDDELFERLTRYLDFENADKTSNHVERENREFRKRQKAHYRIRSRRSMCALLDLLTIRKPVPTRPRMLRPRQDPNAKLQEVARAA